MATRQKSSPNSQILDCLNRIFQAEMSGIIRYLHYSFMVMGYNRIPIQKWFRDQAQEASDHAVIIGEKITALGGHPSVVSAGVEETNEHSIQALLSESARFEEESLKMYKELVRLAGDDIALEEMAREFVRLETEHLEEVSKMLRAPH